VSSQIASLVSSSGALIGQLLLIFRSAIGYSLFVSTFLDWIYARKEMWWLEQESETRW